MNTGNAHAGKHRHPRRSSRRNLPFELPRCRAAAAPHALGHAPRNVWSALIWHALLSTVSFMAATKMGWGARTVHATRLAPCGPRTRPGRLSLHGCCALPAQAVAFSTPKPKPPTKKNPPSQPHLREEPEVAPHRKGAAPRVPAVRQAGTWRHSWSCKGAPARPAAARPCCFDLAAAVCRQRLPLCVGCLQQQA